MAARLFHSTTSEEASLLHEYELQPLEPVPSSIITLASTLGIHSNELPSVLPRFAKIKRFSPWIPEIDPDHRRAQTFRTKWSDRSRALAVQQTIAFFVLAANASWTAWLVSSYGTVTGIGAMYLGDCSKAKRLNLWLHLLINILSTLLLGSSDYCMQLLVGPTRDEVDSAHEMKVSLDIGVPSVKNLRHIARKNAFVWCCLGCSSALLHLL